VLRWEGSATHCSPGAKSFAAVVLPGPHWRLHARTCAAGATGSNCLYNSYVVWSCEAPMAAALSALWWPAMQQACMQELSGTSKFFWSCLRRHAWHTCCGSSN